MAYPTFMPGRLIALDIQPVIRPVDVGETCRNIFSKIVIMVKGPEANMECKYDQMCGRYKAGIDGVINRVQSLWDENLSTEE